MPGCVDGRVPTCTPGDPDAELCNGVDDDCDGDVDELLELGLFGDPVVVRTDEATSRACARCPLVEDAGLALGEDNGMVAVFRLGFNNQRPAPNLFSLRLDVDGRPIGDFVQLGGQPLWDQLAIDSTPALSAVLARGR